MSLVTCVFIVMATKKPLQPCLREIHLFSSLDNQLQFENKKSESVKGDIL